ncbi:MAG TPA: type II CAAX endopeptidase family protein [Planctomycetaceae bacterium]|nr:type II CAAX endopeptidase family protein [Planctomycetaceae bacterium]
MIEPQRESGTSPHEIPEAQTLLPASEVFLGASEDLAFSAGAAGQNPSAPPTPRPGFWESMAWMAGAFLIQFIAGILGAVILGIISLSTIGFDALQTSASSAERLVAVQTDVAAYVSENLIFVLATAQIATVFYALIAIRWRLGRGGLSRMGWQSPGGGRLILVALMVIPLQLVCAQFQQVISDGIGPSESFAKMMEDLAKVPLPMLIMVIALGPAFAEELLFRGFIGRGLVGRLGIVGGVLVTSLLFGALHGYPSQAIAVVPLGIAMHFVYLATRSFWAPIMLHFLNNALAVLLMKIHGDMPVSKLVEESASLPIPVLAVSAAAVISMGWLLWQTRVNFALPDGSAWDPGYATSEVPPKDVDAHPICQRPRALLLACSASSLLGLVALIWWLAPAA